MGLGSWPLVDPSVIAGKEEIVQQERAKCRMAEEAAKLSGGEGPPCTVTKSQDWQGTI